MQIPPVGIIEAGLDVLRTRDPRVVEDELTEFRLLGARVDRPFLPKGLQTVATDVERGYLLGLETARAVLETMPAAVLAGVEL